VKALINDSFEDQVRCCLKLKDESLEDKEKKDVKSKKNKLMTPLRLMIRDTIQKV
jgi:hypothetical protein